MSMKWGIDHTWTLFLDRDGVINVRLMGTYVRSKEEFQFLPEVPQTIAELSSIFGRIVVVTNQQGIGKGIMSERNLHDVHSYMCAEVESMGGKIDHCFYAPELANSGSNFRKPNPGMALEAQEKFPEIHFERSVMVGDSDSDIVFGQQLGMKTVRVRTVEPIGTVADETVESLNEFLKALKK
jgi:D-glycero-D-manno-heptose 1,7-bisphosphate phosphatase